MLCGVIMRTLNVYDLIARVREITDLTDTEFVTDDEIGHYLNRSYQALYNEIAESNQDYFTKTIRFRSVANELVLPLDFYKLRALDLYYGNFFYTISHVSLREREGYQFNESVFRPYNVRGSSELYRYNIEGDKLTLFTQLSDCSSDFVLHYIPRPGNVGEGSRLPKGWENYVILKSAVLCRIKEESSYRELKMLADEELNRVRKLCQERDLAQPERIIDIYENEGYLSYGQFGVSLRSSLQGLSEQTLLPFMGSCPYPNFIEEENYVLRRENIFLNSYERFVFALTVKSGLQGKYGDWVLCDARRDAGYIWSSDNSNTMAAQFISIGALREYITTHNAISVTVDPQIYTDDVGANKKNCLFYDKAQSYNIHIPTPALFPGDPGTPFMPPGSRTPLRPTTDGGTTGEPSFRRVADPVTVYVTYLDPGVTYDAADVTSGALPAAVDGQLETAAFGKGTLPRDSTDNIVTVATPVWPDATPQAQPRHQLVVVTGNARIVSYYLSGFRGINQVAALTYLGTRGNLSYYRSSSLLIYRVSGQTKEFGVRVDG